MVPSSGGPEDLNCDQQSDDSEDHDDLYVNDSGDEAQEDGHEHPTNN